MSLRSTILAIALATGFAPLAQLQAAPINLGTLSAPTTIPIANAVLSGLFEDLYSFSIDAGGSFLFSAFLSTPFSNRFFILDLDAELLKGAQPIAEGHAETVTLPPFPARNVTFDPVLLESGDYRLRVFGTATAAFPGPTSSYDGSLTFAPTPVPEPGGLALLGAGLIALVLAGRTPRSFPAVTRQARPGLPRQQKTA